MKVLVFSDDANVRAQVRLAIGHRPAADLPAVEYVEVATQPAVVARLDEGGIDVVVVDAEAQPAGGLGVCRQAKDEVYDCPPVLAIIARRDDGWLATWSRADAVVALPLDPMAVARSVADLMRRRAASRLPVL
ncbi:putative response regulatory protein [Actinomadura rubteroloni]|uniref:Putative response regulatory protein n=2 Tax=Actinomadura rubteroloni TaxID=1926885 RepID=A0A2P4UGG1_9ACTN|nr:putative response regulatory protein [Actinomadura rubteroloni]